MLYRAAGIYSPGTAEFRLLERHYAYLSSYQRNRALWEAMRALDSYSVATVPYLASEKRSELFEADKASFLAVLDLVDPFVDERRRSQREDEARRKVTDAEKLQYIGRLRSGKYKFHSLKDIQKAMSDIEGRQPPTES